MDVFQLRDRLIGDDEAVTRGFLEVHDRWEERLRTHAWVFGPETSKGQA